MDRSTAMEQIKEILRKSSYRMRCKQLLQDIMGLAPHLLKFTGMSKKSMEKFIRRHRHHFRFDCDGYVHIVEMPESQSALSPPMHFCGPLKKLATTWGIVGHGQSEWENIFFFNRAYDSDQRAWDLTTELKEGDFMDCLFSRSVVAKGCKYEAIRVWKADTDKPNPMKIPVEPLSFPVLCGVARVGSCEDGVGFLTIGSGDKDVKNEELRDILEYAIFNVHHCCVPENFVVSNSDTVKFLATRLFVEHYPCKLWSCERLWPQHLQVPEQPVELAVFQEATIVDLANREGGKLLMVNTNYPITFKWDTIMAYTMFLKPRQFEKDQQCIATIFASDDVADEFITDLRPVDSDTWLVKNQQCIATVLDNVDVADDLRSADSEIQSWLEKNQQCNATVLDNDDIAEEFITDNGPVDSETKETTVSGEFPEAYVSFDQGLDWLKEIILSCGGTCSIRSLHGHFKQTSAQIRSLLGKNLDGLTQLLTSLPEHFVLTDFDGEFFVSLVGKLTEGIQFLNWIMRDCDGMTLDCIVEDLQVARCWIQEEVGLTKEEVRAFLQRYPDYFEVFGDIVRCRGKTSVKQDAPIKEDDVDIEFLEEKCLCQSTGQLYEDPVQMEVCMTPLGGAARSGLVTHFCWQPDHFASDDESCIRGSKHLTLPVHHRGQLMRLEKGWGIIQCQKNHDIFFGRHVLVTALNFEDTRLILQAGCAVDCLYVPELSGHSLKNTALRVWKVYTEKQPCPEIWPSHPLPCPLLYGEARVAYCKAEIGFLKVVRHDQCPEECEGANPPELVIFHLQHCLFVHDLRLAIDVRVNFLATKVPNNGSRYKLWDCAAMWKWQAKELLPSTYDVSATLEIASRKGGHLSSDSWNCPNIFHWKTLAGNGSSGVVELSYKQPCMATVFTTEDGVQIITSLQPKCSSVIHQQSDQAGRVGSGSERASVKPILDCGKEYNTISLRSPANTCPFLPSEAITHSMKGVKYNITDESTGEVIGSLRTKAATHQGFHMVVQWQ